MMITVQNQELEISKRFCFDFFFSLKVILTAVKKKERKEAVQLGGG